MLSSGTARSTATCRKSGSGQPRGSTPLSTRWESGALPPSSDGRAVGRARSPRPRSDRPWRPLAARRVAPDRDRAGERLQGAFEAHRAGTAAGQVDRGRDGCWRRGRAVARVHRRAPPRRINRLDRIPDRTVGAMLKASLGMSTSRPSGYAMMSTERPPQLFPEGLSRVPAPVARSCHATRLVISKAPQGPSSGTPVA